MYLHFVVGAVVAVQTDCEMSKKVLKVSGKNQKKKKRKLLWLLSNKKKALPVTTQRFH